MADVAINVKFFNDVMYMIVIVPLLCGKFKCHDVYIIIRVKRHWLEVYVIQHGLGIECSPILMFLPFKISVATCVLFK
jgi:hypothetical protein